MTRKRKNYSHPKGHKSNFKRKPQQEHADRKKKNFKFIKRSKEAEETQRRQKIIEDKYRLQHATAAEDSMSENEIQEENPYDQLLTSLQQNKEQYKAIESSSEEDEIQSDEEMIEEDEDNVNLDQENNDLDTEEEDKIDNESNSDTCQISDEDLEDAEGVAEEIEEEQTDEDENQDIDKQNQSIDKEDSPEPIEEEEFDEELEKLENSPNLKNLDPFSFHIERDLSPKLVDNLLLKSPKTKKAQINWPQLGNLIVEIPTVESNESLSPKNTNRNKKKSLLLDDQTEFASEGKLPERFDCKAIDLIKCFVKNQLANNATEANKNINVNIGSHILSPLQTELFSILNNYQDLYYSQRTLNNCDEIRFVYCLHALNHMLKTRTKILHHNARLCADNKKEQAILSDTFRDQGLVRPKILIILPFKDSAFKVVNILSSLLFGSSDSARSKHILNYSRFVEEYTGESIHFPKRNPKPEDYEKIFSGNTDDTFRIGISLTKKSMKLYTEFYSSDILLSSPLGLRMIVGAPGDAERDFDFLSSIEILILDQAELFFAQNWEHLLHVLDHMHLQPQSVRNTDFSRVRSWYLNGLAKFYKQTILLTSHELPEFRSLYNNKCTNYRGKIRQANPILNGTIRNVVVQIPQIFHKVDVSSIQSSFDIRFKYFTDEIFPQYKSPSMAHCMIYVPSYFDYVRLRNYFKAESINFVQICEYTKDGKIARARDMFYHSAAHFLLYSERAHFFRRTRIKGIRHIIMYQPPNWPHFYSEILNLMQEANQNPRDGLETSMSLTVLYTKYDMLQVSAIIGTERANKILQSNKISHMFTTGD